MACTIAAVRMAGVPIRMGLQACKARVEAVAPEQGDVVEHGHKKKHEKKKIQFAIMATETSNNYLFHVSLFIP